MPNVIIPDKICTHCGGNRWSLKMYNKLSSSGERYKTYICYQCELIRGRIKSQKYRLKYPEKIKIASKKQNDKVRADPIRYRKNLDATNKLKAEKRYKHIDVSYRIRSSNNLTDNYVKRLFIQDSSLRYSDISSSIIKIKRKQIKLYRHAKEIASSTNSGNR